MRPRLFVSFLDRSGGLALLSPGDFEELLDQQRRAADITQDMNEQTDEEDSRSGVNYMTLMSSIRADR